jgi:anti-sigma B factor antagonist
MPSPVDLSSPSPAPALSVNHSICGGGVCVVAPDGEIDLASAPLLKSSLAALLAENYTRFVLDLSAVRHIDSTGLGVLVGFARRLPVEGLVTIAEAPEGARRLLKLTGLDHSFATFARVDDALAYIGERAGRAKPSLNPDAAIVIGLAATALPFADSAVAEVQRWIRILQTHGEAGHALSSLGLADSASATAGPEADGPEHPRRSSVTRVTTAATELAIHRDSTTVSTIDLLLAVMMVYGAIFDDVLRAHGSDSAKLIECLGASPAAASIG